MKISWSEIALGFVAGVISTTLLMSGILATQLKENSCSTKEALFSKLLQGTTITGKSTNELLLDNGGLIQAAAFYGFLGVMLVIICYYGLQFYEEWKNEERGK